MSDEQDQSGGQDGGNASSENAHTGGAGDGGTGGGDAFKPITSEAELVAWKEATRKQMVSEVRKTVEADAKRKADEEAAKAKGEWETLATQRAERITELEAEVATRDRDALRAKVAAKHKLPEALAARLAGDTEAELEADAKELAKHVAQRQAPDTEAGAGAKGASGPSDRPIKKPATGEKTPAHTFDGRPKVAWPTR